MTENGEELEATEGDDRSKELISRALSGRNLTPEEEQIEKEMEVAEITREEVIDNDKQ